MLARLSQSPSPTGTMIDPTMHLYCGIHGSCVQSPLEIHVLPVANVSHRRQGHAAKLRSPTANCDLQAMAVLQGQPLVWRHSRISETPC